MKGNRTFRRVANRLLARLWTRSPAWAGAYARWRLADERGSVPWAAARTGLADASVALVTTAGVHLDGQEPFDMDAVEGDASFRIIPAGASADALRITHDYYEHGAADRDPNTVFPLQRLHELARAGKIGGVAPRHIGAMGHVFGSQLERLRHETAPAIARLLAEDGVDYAVISPG